ncbi:MAG: hypothetical protein K0U68_08630 [Gammaproteobacteria bacterium]|nr:hypothetical protein [Gammaproteobacteria bacterium]
MRRIICYLLLLVSANSVADISVITNINNGIDSVSRQKVQDIFMGRSRSFPEGNFALPLDLNPLRSEFYFKLTGRPVEQINAYWARIMFSGQASPPTMLPDEQTLLKTIRENTGAIGYIDSNHVDKTQVRVLFILK